MSLCRFFDSRGIVPNERVYLLGKQIGQERLDETPASERYKLREIRGLASGTANGSSEHISLNRCSRGGVVGGGKRWW